MSNNFIQSHFHQIKHACIPLRLCSPPTSVSSLNNLHSVHIPYNIVDCNFELRYYQLSYTFGIFVLMNKLSSTTQFISSSNSSYGAPYIDKNSFFCFSETKRCQKFLRIRFCFRATTLLVHAAIQTLPLLECCCCKNHVL